MIMKQAQPKRVSQFVIETATKPQKIIEAMALACTMVFIENMRKILPEMLFNSYVVEMEVDRYRGDPA